MVLVMLQAPKISVILTSFNHSKYLREAIESVLNQTYENFELIIWDDASEDDSWEIINSYTDSRIKAFQNSESKRGVYGINKAISEVAQAEYIAIHHSDDIWELNKLEKQVDFLDSHPAIGAVFSNAQAIDESGAPYSDTSHYYSSVFDRENRSRQEWLRLFFDQGNALCHPSVLIRKQCYSDCGLYRFGLAQIADFDMWIRLCLKYEIHVMPDRLVKFRVRDNEANSSGNRPETRARVLFEFSILLPLYLEITHKDDLLKVFPEAAAFCGDDDETVHYAMARAMLETKTFDFVVPFALKVLFEILNSPKKAKLVDFDVIKFVKLTAELDPLKMCYFDKLNQLVAEREAQLAEGNVQLAEREAQIIEYHGQLVERDARINENAIVLSQRDTQVAELETLMSQRDTQVAELETLLSQREAQLAEHEAVVSARDAQIAEIYTSKSWRITKPVRAISTLLIRRTKHHNGSDMKHQAKLSLLYKLIKLSIANPAFVIRNLNLANIRRFLAAAPRHNEETVVNLAKDKIEQDKVLARVHQADETSHPGLLKAQALEKCYPGITQPIGLGNIVLLEEKISAPPFVVDPQAPARVNVLLPQLDPLIMFGGYIACLQFIAKIQSEGFKVRILLTESDRFDREAVNAKLASNPALQRAVAAAEVEDITQGTHKLVISPEDAFVGYSFWTCIKAHHLAKAIGKEFIFFLQEYEPIFHPHDSLYAIGSYVYRLPHKVIFNTELLADYFRSKKLGVFSRHEGEELEDRYVAFQHALTPTTPPSIEQLAQRETKRLLFYGRPEGHARRNVFEIGILGLKAAIANGVFDSDWEFHGVGTLGPDYDVDLGHGRVMKLSGTLPQSDYGKALGEFDIGLSLMLAPHPSILPFEMASAGQIVVTNTYESRTCDVLRAISPNIEPCEADPFAIAEALETAVQRAKDSEARIHGTSFDWVRDWDDAFNPQVIEKISRILRA